MAKYGYAELKSAAAEGRRIGGYQGFDVYSCSKWSYNNAKNKFDRFYVLYDDRNYMVRDGKIYGTINSNGQLDLWDTPRTYVTPQQVVREEKKPEPAKQKAKSQTSQTRIVPASAYSAFVAGVGDSGGIVSSENFFAQLDKEINELLAKPFVFDVGEDMPWAKK